MRPGTGGCADTKDPALIGCDEEEAESVDACPPRIYVRLNDREWGGGEEEIRHLYLEGAPQNESERHSRIDMKQSARSRLTLMVRGL